MLMSVARPPAEMIVPGDSVFACAAAWSSFSSHPIKRPNSQHQLRPHVNGLFLDSVNLMSEHEKGGPQRSRESQALRQRLNVYEDGGFNGRSSSVGSGNGSILTGDAYSSLGSTASPFSTSSSPHVSHFPANPRTDWTLTPNSNALLSSTAPTNPAYYDWQHGFGRGAPSHLATFASSSQDGSQWPPQPPLGSQPHGTDAQMLNYSQNQYFMLGENPTVFSPQAMSGFGSSFTAPGMALKAMPEDDDLNFLHDGSVPFYDLSSSFSSNGASDTLDAMMLKNPNSTHSPWAMPGDHLGAEGLPCIAGTAGGPSLVEQPLSSPNSWEVSSLVSAPQATVSPKLLRLRPTPTPTSSSESIRTSFLAGNPRDAAASRVASCSGSPSTLSQAMDIDAASSSAPKTRKMLPDRAPRPAHRGRSRDGEGYPNISKSSCRRPPRDSSLPSLRQLGKANAKTKPGSPLCRPLPLLSPAPLKSPRQQPTVAPIFTDPETEERRAKDEFLIESKQKGMTYKQIRLAGGFTEAESTLRGRYRTLTKSREARVRKPEWSTRDITLLEQGVREYAKSSDPNSHRIPWKKVGEYIVKNGGTYHFGNSTCRKKWDELVREQTALGRDVRRPFYEQAAAQSVYTEMSYRSQQGYGPGSV